jgi:hypothetical protein
VNTDECQRNKDFLAIPWLDWVGMPEAHRISSR